VDVRLLGLVSSKELNCLLGWTVARQEEGIWHIEAVAPAGTWKEEGD
jgi:hypothetical protein